MGEDCAKGMYKGETASNGYTRGGEHISALEARDTKNSPLWRHCVSEHRGEMQEFGMTVTGSYRNDTMLRQITEAVQINNMDPNTLMNDRAEWNMTRIPRAIVTAV